MTDQNTSVQADIPGWELDHLSIVVSAMRAHATGSGRTLSAWWWTPTT